LASAPAALKGKRTPMTSLQDLNGDGLPDLVIHVDFVMGCSSLAAPVRVLFLQAQGRDLCHLLVQLSSHILCDKVFLP
jgi:hypothetical protein